MIAAAGGVVPGGADVVTLVGNRDGKPDQARHRPAARSCSRGRADLDMAVENGDIIYVDRAPSFYMYGEVQRPGQLRVERGMTLMQALAQAGGLTRAAPSAASRSHRKDASGAVQVLETQDDRSRSSATT